MPKQVFRAEDGYDSVDLLKYARGHLHAAEVLFRSDFYCLDSAGYLAHLAIELLVKAAILNARGSFPSGHSLQSLLVEAASAGVSLPILPKHEGTIFVLSSFQDGRYPTPSDPVQIGNADLEPIQQLWDDLLESLDPELRETFLAAEPIYKGGRVLMVKDLRPESAAPRHPAAANEGSA